MSSSITDGSMTSDKTLQWSPPKSPTDDAGSFSLTFAPFLSSMGLFMQNRNISWLALFVVLSGLTRRDLKTFSWSNFIASFGPIDVRICRISVFGIVTDILKTTK